MRREPWIGLYTSVLSIWLFFKLEMYRGKGRRGSGQNYRTARAIGISLVDLVESEKKGRKKKKYVRVCACARASMCVCVGEGMWYPGCHPQQENNFLHQMRGIKAVWRTWIRAGPCRPVLSRRFEEHQVNPCTTWKVVCFWTWGEGTHQTMRFSSFNKHCLFEAPRRRRRPGSPSWPCGWKTSRTQSSNKNNNKTHTRHFFLSHTCCGKCPGGGCESR